MKMLTVKVKVLENMKLRRLKTKPLTVDGECDKVYILLRLKVSEVYRACTTVCGTVGKGSTPF